MSYYSALEPFFSRLGDDSAVGHNMRDTMKQQIIELYRHILEFQIRSVVRFCYSNIRRYAADAIQKWDWKQMETKIRTLDADICNDLHNFTALVSGEELESLATEVAEQFQALNKTSTEQL